MHSRRQFVGATSHELAHTHTHNMDVPHLPPLSRALKHPSRQRTLERDSSISVVCHVITESTHQRHRARVDMQRAYPTPRSSTPPQKPMKSALSLGLHGFPSVTIDSAGSHSYFDASNLGLRAHAHRGGATGE